MDAKHLCKKLLLNSIDRVTSVDRGYHMPEFEDKIVANIRDMLSTIDAAQPVVTPIEAAEESSSSSDEPKIDLVVSPLEFAEVIKTLNEYKRACRGSLTNMFRLNVAKSNIKRVIKIVEKE